MAPDKVRVLLVDDEPSIVKTVSKRLEVAGFDVIVAMTGEEAITKALTERPNAIVLDLMLPTISGMQVCETLKKDQRCKDIPVVVMFTGKGDEADEERCRKVGAAAYVTKTQGSAELISQLKALLGSA